LQTVNYTVLLLIFVVRTDLTSFTITRVHNHLHQYYL